MKKYRYLLFDADDTLLDFTYNSRRAFSKLCEIYRLPCGAEGHALFEQINQPLWRALERGEITREVLVVERFRRFLDQIGSGADAAQVNDTFLTLLGQFSKPTDGAEEVCRTLSKQYKLYIVTNSLARVHLTRMEHCPLAPYITGSFVSERIGFEKPDRRFFDAVLTQIDGITRDNCLLIGDSLTSDMTGGIGAGLPVCFYNPRSIPVPGDLPIDCTITDLRQLLPLLLKG